MNQEESFIKIIDFFNREVLFPMVQKYGGTESGKAGIAMEKIMREIAPLDPDLSVDLLEGIIKMVKLAKEESL